MLGQPISMLIPEVVGLPADRPPARGRDRDRPRADDHRAAAQARRRRQVRRVLRPGPRVPDDRRPRDARQHVAGVRRDDRDLPDRRDDARLPAADRPRRGARRSWSRRTRRSRGCSARPTSPDPVYTPTIELDLSTVEPSLAGPKRPQDRVSLAPGEDASSSRRSRRCCRSGRPKPRRSQPTSRASRRAAGRCRRRRGGRRDSRRFRQASRGSITARS